MFFGDYSHLISMNWHCLGNPYGGPTIDADGSLRVCGYRKGELTSQMSIFDLPDKWEKWRLSVFDDAMQCPRCGWSYPWMYDYWKKREPKFGKKIFSSHAGKHIPKQKWSERIIK